MAIFGHAPLRRWPLARGPLRRGPRRVTATWPRPCPEHRAWSPLSRRRILVVLALGWATLLAALTLHGVWPARASQSAVAFSGDISADPGVATPEADMQPQTPDPPRRPWQAVHNWVYWLDGPRLEQIGATNFELAVIDYSANGSAAGEFSQDQIAALRHATCERRVLAYLSIGQAEDFRFYWRSSWSRSRPDWVVGRDPDWEGAYWVRYWDPAWQELVYRYLDRILAQGFDGVYLDRVDAYLERHARGHERDMVDFVLAIAAYARARSPLGDDFGIVVQNASGLATRHPDYVATVTGIGREELYVVATNRRTRPAERAAGEAELDLFRQSSRGQLVLTVDYADSPELVREAYERSRAAGYVPYVSDRALERLRLDHGHEPACAPPVGSAP